MRKTRVLRGIATTGLALLALSGCDMFGGSDRYEYGGVLFSGNSKPIKEDRASFVATAGPASASLDGAIEATRYEATKYCIEYLGTSDIDWTVGPETPAEQLVVEDDRLVFRGRCVE